VERATQFLIFLLIIAVMGVGVVVKQADDHAREERARALCVERVQATATIGLLTPTQRVDADGRVKMIDTLADLLDAC
jgi:hypothetical protein